MIGNIKTKKVAIQMHVDNNKAIIDKVAPQRKSLNHLDLLTGNTNKNNKVENIFDEDEIDKLMNEV